MIHTARLTLQGSAYALDGGTTVLMGTDGAGQEHTVMLVQHSHTQPSKSLHPVPGRLYFDGQLVPIRSEFKSQILSLLKSAEVRYNGRPPFQGERIQLSPNALILGNDIREVLTRTPEDNIRALTAKVIEFVESSEYLHFAQRVEQAADDTKYDVWVVWDAGNLCPSGCARQL